MKFTWGTGIALTLIVFVLTMAFAVYKVMQQDFDLVTSDYYEEELVYQKKIDQQENALALGEPAKITVLQDGLSITLPEKLQGQSGDLKIEMYCVTNEDLDFSIVKNQWSAADLQVKHENLGTGKWIAKITFSLPDIAYYFEPEIYLP